MKHVGLRQLFFEHVFRWFSNLRDEDFGRLGVLNSPRRIAGLQIYSGVCLTVLHVNCAMTGYPLAKPTTSQVEEHYRCLACSTLATSPAHNKMRQIRCSELTDPRHRPNDPSCDPMGQQPRQPFQPYPTPIASCRLGNGPGGIASFGTDYSR